MNYEWIIMYKQYLITDS